MAPERPYGENMKRDWTVIENVLSDMWDNALIERDLYKKLKDDMNYTIAIKSNMLYMNGIISKANW